MFPFIRTQFCLDLQTVVRFAEIAFVFKSLKCLDRGQ